ncbi:complex I NDUFA9 subunit family protein [Geobacter sp. DSM 9736]|uniref:complex I NDUFA9 subunit family protein n=1 Tax=Geobacter sp. DSM 9736 TaxID=1277350 RepID=UPI000B50E29A|nr:complex I NDUFA9 subunit family protein [Geobacter sp. DSM 9736]SNB47456.1 NADH dehydrogenase [Geobacter sp. DSM 9736]
MKVLLSGGTGFVGGYVRRALLAKGHSVRVLVHRHATGIGDGIEQVTGDVMRPQTLEAAAAGCDAVINLVGIIREFPARGVTFEALHVRATEHMVQSALKAGASRYIQMSALGTRPEAVSAYHRTKFRAEEIVRDSGLDYTIFRPSVIFGAGDDFINKLAGFVKALPAVPVIGSGSYRLQPIHAEDVARCFALSLEMPETRGATYSLCGPDRVTYNELLDLIGRILGKPRIAKLRNPLFLMKLVVPLFQRFPVFPLTTDQITMLLEESICDGGWRKIFPFSPIPLEEGIRSYLSR